MSAEFDKLVKIVSRLRAPDGCPWDREQTHRTIKENLIEEAYELVEAIEQNDNGAICEEIGDCMLLLAFHAQLAAEEDAFTVTDALDGINEKLIRRHPHVFKDVKVGSAEEVVKNWDQIKREEKQRESILDGIPRSLPALIRAQKMQKRAAKVGFDWEKLDDVFAKLHEEIDELKTECAGGDTDRIEDELGDTLFALVNVARTLDISSEEALNRTIGKFRRRFRYIEKTLKLQGKDIHDSNLREMDALWNEAKKKDL